jgi:hypothetical protein
VLNVLVKQFDLVALFTNFNAKQVAHREHADPALAIDNRQMSLPINSMRSSAWWGVSSHWITARNSLVTSPT